MEKRLEAWHIAKELVDPIVEQHGLEDRASSANFLSTSTTITKVTQHMNHIFDVATWLLGEPD